MSPGSGSRLTPTAALFIGAALLFVAISTLTPVPGQLGTDGFCIFCGTLGGLDFTLNVVLFIPLGAAIWNATASWRHCVVVGLVVSIAIEALQIRVVAGRDASVGDVLANGLGALSGAGMAVLSLRIRDVTGIAAQRFAVIGGIVTAHVVAASALLLQPRETVYPQWLQWSPAKTNEEPFRGTLDSVELNGQVLLRGQVLRASETLDSARHLRLKVTVSGQIPESQRPAIIVRLVHPSEEEALQLTQRGTGVAFRSYSVATRLQFRTLQVRLDGALAPANAADSRALQVESNPRQIAISASRGGQRITSVALPRTVGLTWALLLPWNAAIGPDWWLANVCWLAMLILPVSYLTARSWRTGDPGRGMSPAIVSWWPTAFAVLTLGALPPLTGMSPLSLVEWLGVIAGILAGTAIERLVALRHSRA